MSITIKIKIIIVIIIIIEIIILTILTIMMIATLLEMIAPRTTITIENFKWHKTEFSKFGQFLGILVKKWTKRSFFEKMVSIFGISVKFPTIYNPFFTF